MLNKYSIIDIGSNSTHMDILCVDENNLITQLEYKTTLNKLGQFIVSHKYIPQEKLDELVQILDSYIKFSKQQNIEKIYAFTTSIFREIENADKSLLYVKEKTGLDIEIVSEEKETDLAYLSVVNCYDIKSDNMLIMDIGGGSCEILILEKGEIIKKQSFSIGLSKIKRILNFEDNYDSFTESKIKEYTNKLIQEELVNFIGDFRVTNMIGTSSIFKCLGFVLYDETGNLSDLKDKTINIEQLKYVINNMVDINVDESKRDIIYIGSIFLKELLESINLSNILICPWSIREAYLLNIQICEENLGFGYKGSKNNG